MKKEFQSQETYESLLLALVHDLDDGPAMLLDDGEWPSLHVLLDISLCESATDDTFCVKDSVLGVAGIGVLGGIPDPMRHYGRQ